MPVAQRRGKGKGKGTGVILVFAALLDLIALVVWGWPRPALDSDIAWCFS
jgi:hypothetical protein